MSKKIKKKSTKGQKKTKEVILSLDVSSASTGFCVFRGGRWNKSKKSYGLIKMPTKMSLPEKLVYFRNEIEKLLHSVNPTKIVIEDVFQLRNTKTLKTLARFSGVALEVCRRFLGEDPKLVLTSRVRSFLGCGKKKEDAFNFICAKYSLDWSFSKMNDVTDAICLALYLRGNIDEG